MKIIHPSQTKKYIMPALLILVTVFFMWHPYIATAVPSGYIGYLASEIIKDELDPTNAQSGIIALGVAIKNTLYDAPEKTTVADLANQLKKADGGGQATSLIDAFRTAGLTWAQSQDLSQNGQDTNNNISAAVSFLKTWGGPPLPPPPPPPLPKYILDLADCIKIISPILGSEARLFSLQTCVYSAMFASHKSAQELAQMFDSASGIDEAKAVVSSMKDAGLANLKTPSNVNDAKNFLGGGSGSDSNTCPDGTPKPPSKDCKGHGGGDGSGGVDGGMPPPIKCDPSDGGGNSCGGPGQPPCSPDNSAYEKCVDEEAAKGIARMCSQIPDSQTCKKIQIENAKTLTKCILLKSNIFTTQPPPPSTPGTGSNNINPDIGKFLKVDDNVQKEHHQVTLTSPIGPITGTYTAPFDVSDANNRKIWGVPVLEEGPLLTVTVIKQIPMLVNICNAIATVEKDTFKIATFTKDIASTTRAILKDTGAILKDTNELVDYFEVKNPDKRKEAAAAIKDAQTSNALALGGGRSTGNMVGDKKEKRPYIPTISRYVKDEAKGAVDKFNATLNDSFANDQNNPLGAIVKDQTATQGALATQDDQAAIDMIKGTNNPYDAILLAHAIQNNRIETAKKNATAEWTTNGGIIGSKKCPDGVKLLATKMLDGSAGPSVCPTDLQITTPAFDIKAVSEKLQTAKIDLTESATYSEDIPATDVTADLQGQGEPGANGVTYPGDGGGPNGGCTGSGCPPPPPNLCPDGSNPPCAPPPPQKCPAGTVGTPPNCNQPAPTPTKLTLTDYTMNLPPHIVFSTDNETPDKCTATSDWLTFPPKPKGESYLTPSNLFKNRDPITLLPIKNRPQYFYIDLPTIFNLSAVITPAPDRGTDIQLSPQKEITNGLIASTVGGPITQTSSYIPTMGNAQIGDTITLSINNTLSVSVLLASTDPIKVEKQLIDATTGVTDLNGYNFTQQVPGFTSKLAVVVSNRIPVQTSLPQTTTYSLQCNVGNQTISPQDLKIPLYTIK